MTKPDAQARDSDMTKPDAQARDSGDDRGLVSLPRLRVGLN